jgi:N-acetylglucosamine kinase-like BadF-type ATPase
MKTPAELEAEFQTRIKKLPEVLKELYENPITTSKDEMCERLLTFAEAGDEKAREIYEEACRETQE